MNVRKIVGRGLMGVGFLLMLIGTASVPSSSWAASVPRNCFTGCNKCGLSEDQGNNTFKCFRQVNGVNQRGYCNNTSNNSSCNGCTGECDEASLVGGGAACSCL